MLKKNIFDKTNYRHSIAYELRLNSILLSKNLLYKGERVVLIKLLCMLQMFDVLVNKKFFLKKVNLFFMQGQVLLDFLVSGFFKFELIFLFYKKGFSVEGGKKKLTFKNLQENMYFNKGQLYGDIVLQVKIIKGSFTYADYIFLTHEIFGC